ncbi:uncharacterized protein LOC130657879 [Hydractinia symbiolongicarpus]|uniref:uncharacterized protein LOC130657878 n=1 Tax=Hydractinia symbiolongicarpus TaxID=13093 RepID=UPI00254D8CCF|nr:uncharacterized protein LOC130657878 [Hydractinia symbiolongicarpus]XP_057316853.1 uncharacterized protein LOC130657879 [Hydractinia symbiolongicarpus]
MGSRGLSGVVAEIVKVSGYTAVELITSLVNQNTKDGVIPNDRQSSVIVNCFKDNRDTLNRVNYRGLKCVHEVKKVIERVVDKLFRKKIDINMIQFGYVPGCRTTDAIFLLLTDLQFT